MKKQLHGMAKLMALLMVTLCFTGCGHGAGGKVSTNLSVVVWPSLPPAPGVYQHQAHLQKLSAAANALIATNSAIFSQSQAVGNLTNDSPLRGLLGIPAGEAAEVKWVQSTDRRWVYVRSSRSEQRFGRIEVNLKTGLIDSVHDVQALFIISEMERQLRRTIGTREEALRLFGRRASDSPSPEQEQAVKALAEALFLPKDRKYHVQMSAPGGTNLGQGRLILEVPSSSGTWEDVASVYYPTTDDLLSAFGITHPSYRFGGVSFYPAWTNLNTAGFLLDSNGIPYPAR